MLLYKMQRSFTTDSPCSLTHPLLTSQTMNLKPVLLMSIVTLGLSSIGVSATKAQTLPVLSPGEPANPEINLRLNERQREAFHKASEFAFDQFDALLSSGFDPEQLKRPELNQEAEQMVRQLPELVRPDEQQLSVLRTILRNARQQMEKGLGGR